MRRDLDIVHHQELCLPFLNTYLLSGVTHLLSQLFMDHVGFFLSEFLKQLTMYISYFHPSVC